MLAIQVALLLSRAGARARRALCSERGTELPEYVIVLAIIVMLAVVGLVAVKSGLVTNLNGIASCLTSTAAGSATSCQ